jgi:hypothetical protein
LVSIPGIRFRSVFATADVAIIEARTMVIESVFMTNSFGRKLFGIPRNLHLCILDRAAGSSPIMEVTIANTIDRAAAVIRKLSDDGRARIIDHELAAHDEPLTKLLLGNRRAPR